MNGRGWLILLVVLLLIPASRELILGVALPVLFVGIGGLLAIALLTNTRPRR